MAYRKWSSSAKAKVVLDGLSGKMSIAELCNKHQVSQSQYYRWSEEFQTNASKAFETAKTTRKDQEMSDEIKKLKAIIAELTIDLKKTELELSEGSGQ